MRVGVVVLPQLPWREAAPRWRAVEEMGFDAAWTYDHLAWRDLADEPWHATVPTLAAASLVTARVRLGTWVASPNYRHPVPFAKEVMTLDDLSGGRFVLGVGAGGTGWDAEVLGEPVLPPRERVDRLGDFVDLLDALLRSPVTTQRSGRYQAVAARTLPGCVQVPRVPFVVAANGPRAMAVAARHGQGWATTGPDAEDLPAWWDGVAGLVRRFEDVCAAAGRDPAGVDRLLSLDSAPVFSLSSREAFADAAGRAQALGFSEVVVHWPRRSGPYAGEERVLEQVASDLAAR